MKNKQAGRVSSVKGTVMVILILAIVIFIVLRVSGGRRITPAAYFGTKDGEAAIVVNGEVLDAKGIERNGQVYIPYETLWSCIDAGYYLRNDGTLSLVLPENTFSWTAGDEDFVTVDGRYYVSADIVAKHSDAETALFANPARAVIRTDFDGLYRAEIGKDAKLLEKDKSNANVLTGLVKGDTVFFFETGAGMTRVFTPSGYTGYVKTEAILTESIAQKEPVREAGKSFEKLSVSGNVRMVWHYIDMVENNVYLDAYLSDTEGVGIVAPTWFYIRDNSGELVSFADSKYVETANAHGAQVWAVLTDTEPQSADTTEVLKNDAARERVVTQLVDEAVRYGISGINVDMETVKASGAHDFLEFLRELTVKAHKAGIIVSVDNYVPQFTGYYRRDEQAKVIDYVVVMAYDEHNLNSETEGSVASLPFVRKGIEDTLLEVPPERIILGIPFYTRTWTKQLGLPGLGTRVADMNEAQQFVKEHGISLVYDDSVGQNTGTVEDGETRYSIWMEDKTSLRNRLMLVDEYNLAGAAAWRIGDETSDIWIVWTELLGR